MMNGGDVIAIDTEYIRKHHTHQPTENQCTSVVVKHIKAPIHLVWSLVRRFDQPQKYISFLSGCTMQGDIRIGSVRTVEVISGLPGTFSIERLEQFDDDEHILGMKIVGGDHRLTNCYVIVTLHPEDIQGKTGTMVIQSFVVDVPDENTKDETCCLIEAFIRLSHNSLANVSETMALQGGTDPLKL